MTIQKLREELLQRIQAKRIAIELCLHIPEKVMALEAEIVELESLLIWADNI